MSNCIWILVLALLLVLRSEQSVRNKKRPVTLLRRGRTASLRPPPHIGFHAQANR